MADNTLQFETRVDLGGLNSGMSQAASVVQNGATKISGAMQQATAATRNLAQAQQQLGQAAAQGNAQAIAIIQQYQQQVIQTQQAVAGLSTAQQTLATTTTAAAAAQSHQVSTMAATSGAIRELGGALPIRALENFLAKTLGLGPVLQAAFPIVGAIALGEMIGELVGKLKKLADQWDIVAQAQKRAEDGFAAAIQSMETAVDAQSTAMIDQIENTQGHVAALQYGLSHLTLNVTSNDQTVLRQAQARVDALQARIKVGTSEQADTTATGGTAAYTALNEDARAATAELQNATINLSTARIKLDADTRQLNVSTIQLGEAQQAAADKAEQAANKAAAALLRSLELQYNQSVIQNGKTLQGEYQFWNDRLALFTAGSAQYDTIVQKLANTAAEGAAKAHAAIEKFKKEDSKFIDDTASSEGIGRVNAYIAKQAEDVTRTGERWRSYNAEIAKSQEISTQNTANAQLATIAQGQAIGTLTTIQATYQIAAVHTEEYTQKLKELQAQLQAINNDPALKPSEKASQSQAVQNAISQLNGARQVQVTQDRTRQAQAMAAPFLTAFDSINNGFLQVQQKMILGTQSISRDFAEMGANLVVTAASWAEKWLAKQATTYIADHILHLQTETAKTAEATAAATTTTAAVTAANVAQASSYAAVAAAAAAASVAATPFVGPALAAAAAAGTYASTIGYAGLAAFETGGIIPNTGIAMVHAGEAVLPAALTQHLMNSAVNNNTSSSANMTVNANGMSDAHFKQMLTRNATHAVATVHKGLRRMGRA